MAYIRYYDPRYGDLYEVYTDELTGEFESTLRSVGGQLGGEKIFYETLSDLPPHHRNQIEHLIWQQMNPTTTK